MDDQEATRSSRLSWPVLIIGALAVIGAISVVQLVLSIAFSVVKLLVVVGVVALAVVFFRGPPDG